MPLITRDELLSRVDKLSELPPSFLRFLPFESPRSNYFLFICKSMLKFMIFPPFLKILTCVYCLNYTSSNLGKKPLGLEIIISGRLFFQAELSRGRPELIDWLRLCIVNLL